MQIIWVPEANSKQGEQQTMLEAAAAQKIRSQSTPQGGDVGWGCHSSCPPDIPGMFKSREHKINLLLWMSKCTSAGQVLLWHRNANLWPGNKSKFGLIQDRDDRASTDEPNSSGLNIIQGFCQSHSTDSESLQRWHGEVLACVKQKPIAAGNSVYVDVTALLSGVQGALQCELLHTKPTTTLNTHDMLTLHHLKSTLTSWVVAS